MTRRGPALRALPTDGSVVALTPGITLPPCVPVPIPEKTLLGVLARVHANGYGFLHVGKGQPDYFILKQTVEPEYWVRDAMFRFIPEPPSKRGQAPRAKNPVFEGMATE